MNFCHISPTPHLSEFVQDRPVHLTLAHLIEVDAEYTKFYVDQKAKNPDMINIMDNSAFEMYKQGRPMYSSERLIDMAALINPDYIVMSDYPGEPGQKTIDAAKKLGPIYKEAGYGTFFVPQSKEGDIEDYVATFDWASRNPDLVDYIGVSILGVPLAYGVEKGNKLQRFLARWKMMERLHAEGILDRIKRNGQKIHFLGMVDGPNEITLVKEYKEYIDTWDSSAAVWLGLSADETFDHTPTGRLEGKYEEEVDFDFATEDMSRRRKAWENIAYIDGLAK